LKLCVPKWQYFLPAMHIGLHQVLELLQRASSCGTTCIDESPAEKPAPIWESVLTDSGRI
jgi:hypothetical protein